METRDKGLSAKTAFDRGTDILRRGDSDRDRHCLRITFLEKSIYDIVRGCLGRIGILAAGGNEGVRSGESYGFEVYRFLYGGYKK